MSCFNIFGIKMTLKIAEYWFEIYIESYVQEHHLKQKKRKTKITNKQEYKSENQ